MSSQRLDRLDETQRSLLLRGALAYRRGMLTALRYQTDPDFNVSRRYSNCVVMLWVDSHFR